MPPQVEEGGYRCLPSRLTSQWVFQWLDRRLPSFEDAGPGLRLEYVLAVVFGPIIALGLVGGLLFSESACGCDPPLGVGIGLVVLTLATVAMWITTRSGREPRGLGTLRLLGWTALGFTTVVGAMRAVSDVVQIIT